MKTTWKQTYDRFLSTIWNIEASTAGRSYKASVKLLRLLYVVAIEATQGQLALRAMSLVYTTLLSLVPLLALSFSVLKAFGVHNQIEPLLLNFLTPLGQRGFEITERIIGFVENVKVGVLGSIGLALLMYTVISLIQKVEAAFNYVWRIRKPRSFVQKFSNYLSVVMVGPVLVFSAIGITASIMNASIVQSLIAIEPFGTVVLLVGKLIPYLLICSAFTFIYIFLPNTRVKFTAALIGGLIAGILWETTGWLFASLIVTSTKYTAIYSGFAILIMFMMWLYLSWFILLLGAVISYHYQYPHYSDIKNDKFPLSNRLKERFALIILYLIGDSYYHKKKLWTLEMITRRLRIPLEPIQAILDILEKKGFILTTSSAPPAYIPARDIEKIPLEEVYTSVRSAEENAYIASQHIFSSPEIDKVIDQVETAISRELKQYSLKTVITPEKPKV